MTIEIIQNPTATIGLVLILLVSVTAITFLAILAICGFRARDLEELDA